DVLLDSVDERLERVRSLDAEVASAVRVAVEIRDGVRDERVRMRFGPFGRAEQSGLLTVPRRVDDRGLRAPALLVQRAYRRIRLELGHLTGDRVRRAIHPGVVVVAANDPLVGFGAAGEPRNDVIQRLEPEIELDLEMDARGTRPEAIGDRKPAAPG